MATVDELIIEIKAETAQLRNEVKKVNGSLKTTENRSAKLGKALKAAFAGIGIGLAVRAIKNASTAILDTTRKFEDLRATLQANTGSLKETEDAFQMILKFTAGTTFQIDEVTRAFIEFRRIGIKPTEADLKGIGNVAAAQGVSIDQIAQAIFRGGTTSIEQLQSLGFTAKTSGDKMQISFKDTTKEIDKSVESVMKFVREVGETEFADGIEQRANTLTGALSNLGDATEIFKNSIGDAGFKQETIGLVRTLTDITNNSESAAISLGESFGGAVKAIHGAVILLNEAFGNTNTELDEIEGRRGLLDFVTIGGRGGARANIFQLIAAGIEKLKDVADEAAMDNFNFVGGAAPALKEGQTVLDLILGSMDTGGGGSGGGIKARIATLADLKKAIEENKVSITDMATAQDILNKAVASGNITQDAANALYREFLETTGQFGKALAQIGNEVEGLASSLSDDLTTALMNGESALESFKNFAFNVVQSVISAFLELLVIQPIIDAILGAFSISAPKGGTGSTRTRPSGAGFAGGGTVQRGTPTIVGERGAEVFVPNTGGTILNNMNSMNAMGGTPIIVNQSVNFSTGVVPTVRAEVTKMLPQISDVTKGAVLEAAVRGGSFRKGLMGNG